MPEARAQIDLPAARPVAEMLDDERKPVYLLPGFLYASPSPASISTILGSCVAVCLHDPVRRIGGTNHFLLPEAAARETNPLKYANRAIPALIDALSAAGSRPADLRAQVFGGACVLPAFHGTDHLGTRNAKAALALLADFDIPVLAHDLGGNRGRKIVFDTRTGETIVRYLGVVPIQEK